MAQWHTGTVAGPVGIRTTKATVTVMRIPEGHSAALPLRVITHKPAGHGARERDAEGDASDPGPGPLGPGAASGCDNASLRRGVIGAQSESAINCGPGGGGREVEPTGPVASSLVTPAESWRSSLAHWQQPGGPGLHSLACSTRR